MTDPPVAPKKNPAGVQESTFSPVDPYIREYRYPGDQVPAPTGDVLDARAANIATVRTIRSGPVSTATHS